MSDNANDRLERIDHETPNVFGLTYGMTHHRHHGSAYVPNPRLRYMLIGYARVSKADGSQSLDLQRDALCGVGVDTASIYHDFASGAREDRPALENCLRALRKSDVLVVWKLDRLGRNLAHLVNTVQGLSARGVGLRVLAGQGAQPNAERAALRFRSASPSRSCCSVSRSWWAPSFLAQFHRGSPSLSARWLNAVVEDAGETLQGKYQDPWGQSARSPSVSQAFRRSCTALGR